MVPEIYKQSVNFFMNRAVNEIFLALGIVFILFFLIGIYVYYSLAWHTTAKKLKYRYPWIAWVPILNLILILQIGGFYWAWIFLILIPIFGWLALFIIIIVATWRIFEKRRYPGWFSLAPIIPQIGGVLYLISIGFLAWGQKK